MKIAMIGVRGVPAQYGGLETCAEEVSTRLVQRGHDVLVYCRKGTYDDNVTDYKGVRRITLPSIRTKYTDTYSHSLVSMLHALKERPDAILAFNPGIGTLCVIPKLMGYPVALNPNGFDWRRQKWNRIAQFLIRSSAWFCTKIVDQMVIDAVSVQACYNEDFDCSPRALYIPNGANIEPPEENPVDPDIAKSILDGYGLEKDKYILFLSRHVPENTCEDILRAYQEIDTDVKLFFGGAGAYGDPYAEKLKTYESERIPFPGAIFDPLHVKTLHHNCLFVVHGNQPGGTSLGLLKAMGYGCCVMTVNTTDNAYAVRDAGEVYELTVESIRDTMSYLLNNPERVSECRRKAVDRIREEYDWEVVVDKYEAVLSKLAGGGAIASESLDGPADDARVAANDVANTKH